MANQEYIYRKCDQLKAITQVVKYEFQTINNEELTKENLDAWKELRDQTIALAGWLGATIDKTEGRIK